MNPDAHPLLQLPWEAGILQHLSAGALGSLACTCKQLRDAVRRAGLDIWGRVAAQVLGPTHPSLQSRAGDAPVTAEGLQAALQRYGNACGSLLYGEGRAGAQLSLWRFS